MQTEIKVRFADVDSMGHVNNAKYFTYFEQARVEYFKRFPELDFVSLKGPPETSVILASIRCDFKAPAYLDETLVVKIRVRELKRSSFFFEYEITEEKTGRLVAVGESAQVYYNYLKKESMPVTQEMKKRFEEIEGRPL